MPRSVTSPSTRATVPSSRLILDQLIYSLTADGRPAARGARTSVLGHQVQCRIDTAVAGLGGAGHGNPPGASDCCRRPGNACLQATADRDRVSLLSRPSLQVTEVSRITLLKLPPLLQTMKEMVSAQKEQKYRGIKLWRCFTWIGRETAEMRMVPAPPNDEPLSHPVNTTRRVRGVCV